ncbi:MAG: multiheme c-type cytochrome, partial [Bacteroidetes bacterium]|nr:multiheme c-type cytochrome [Bacteroidota bacterium]
MHWQGHSLIALLFGVGFVACHPSPWTGNIVKVDPRGLNLGAMCRIEWEEYTPGNLAAIVKFVDEENLDRLNDQASKSRAKSAQLVLDTAREVHDDIFAETRYPSAIKCQPCHPGHYKEWSVSPHAYALMSPVFNAMQGTVIKLTNGSTGDFCIRCHTPVGMNLGESHFKSTLDRKPITREGVTCVACHRRKGEFGKESGRLALAEGDLFEPVYGPTGNKELDRVIGSGEFDINTERGQSGRDIHTQAKQMGQMTTSGFCGSCHDVNSVGGFRLEEAFSEYKAAPAAKLNISCQDCHMGTEPGLPSGFGFKPAAIIGGKLTKPRKRTNHMFAGPDYSILHPGIFPHNPAAQQLASLSEWLQFDHQAGWGTDEFEDNVSHEYVFPDRWLDIADRYEARDLLNENFELLDKIRVQRKKLLKVGYQLGSVIVEQSDNKAIKFKVEFKNGTNGHNVPTGFDAERVVFLQVTVRDKNGKIVFESGDLDPNGDLRDSHSIYVHNGELPRDKYLFNLQSLFLIRMARGGDREEVLPINYSQDPLPFVRPPTISTLLLGRPPNSRKHRRTIAPLDSKWAKYKVKQSQLIGTEGPYTANIKLIAGMVPVNLIYAIQDVGFDYGASPREVADAVVEGHQVLWEREVVLKPGTVDEQ